MIMDKWVEKNLGKSIDYDGVYGVQCVDLIKHFVKNVLLVEPQSIGNAIEYYRKRKTSSYLKTNFKWISNSAKFVPQKATFAFSPRKAETVIFLSPPEREQPLISIRMTKIIPRASMNL